MAPALFHWFDKVGETEEYNKKDTINSLKSLKDSIKNKYLRELTKTFQRRFRQELVDGKIDQECLIISKNLIKAYN